MPAFVYLNSRLTYHAAQVGVKFSNVKQRSIWHPKYRISATWDNNRLEVKQISGWRTRVKSACEGTRNIMHKKIEKKVLERRASKARRRAISDARRRPFINSHLGHK